MCVGVGVFECVFGDVVVSGVCMGVVVLFP